MALGTTGLFLLSAASPGTRIWPAVLLIALIPLGLTLVAVAVQALLRHWRLRFTIWPAYVLLGSSILVIFLLVPKY